MWVVERRSRVGLACLTCIGLIAIGLAAALGAGSTSAAPGQARRTADRPCASRVESGLFTRGIPASYERHVVRIGPLALAALDNASRPRSAFAALPRRPGRFRPQKLLVLARAGSVVTLAVPRAEQRHLAFLYDVDYAGNPAHGYRLADGEREVTFHACPPTEPSFLRGKTVGRWTEFNGSFVVAGARCVVVEVRTAKRPGPLRKRLSFGAGRCG